MLPFAVMAFVYMREEASGGILLLTFLMVAVWINDIAAFLAGRGFGGPKLAPKLSPNKTWSGALGGLVCSGLVGAIFAGLSDGMVPIGIAFGMVDIDRRAGRRSS